MSLTHAISMCRHPASQWCAVCFYGVQIIRPKHEGVRGGIESAVAGGVDKQFHVDKDEMKTVKAKWSKDNDDKVEEEGDLRFTRQRLHFTFSGVDGFWQSVPRESPCWTGVRSKDRLDSVFLEDEDTNTHTLQQKSFEDARPK